MEDRSLLIKIFDREHNERISEFNLPQWLTCSCFGCTLPLGTDNIMSFEVHFEPMFLGDVSFNYFCKNCSSAFSKHLKCDLRSIAQLVDILSSIECPSRFVNSRELGSFVEHNVVKKILKEQKIIND